jgi:DNA-binding NtrC family response regulator
MIDDDLNAVAWVRRTCDAGFDVRHFHTLSQGAEAVAIYRPEIAFISTSILSAIQEDHRTKSTNACEATTQARQIVTDAFNRLRESDRKLPILVRCTEDSTVHTIAIAASALEGVGLMSTSNGPERLIQQLERIAIERQGQRQPSVQLTTQEHRDRIGTPLLGQSPRMLNVFEAIGAMSRNVAPVLIIGEVGTGKRSTAKLIHQGSEAAHYRLIDAVVCDEAMLHRYLFVDDDLGVVAFQPNLALHTVVIANADRCSVQFQAKLAAAIHGAESVNEVDQRFAGPRLVFTTSNPSNLWPSFMYPLQGDAIRLPPLRDRGDDLGLLIDFFIAEAMGDPVRAVGSQRRATPEIMGLFSDYAWPGNVTELRSVTIGALRNGRRSLVVTGQLHEKLRLSVNLAHVRTATTSFASPENSPATVNQTITNDNFTAQLRSQGFWQAEATSYASSLPPSPEMGMLLGETTEAVEAGLIAAVLHNTNGNIAQSARILGITRVSLRRKIHALNLSVPGRPSTQQS